MAPALSFCSDTISTAVLLLHRLHGSSRLPAFLCVHFSRLADDVDSHKHTRGLIGIRSNSVQPFTCLLFFSMTKKYSWKQKKQPALVISSPLNSRTYAVASSRNNAQQSIQLTKNRRKNEK
jgi:hypothetical protein